MLNRVLFNERPDEIAYSPLPDGKADVWIRRNIREFAVEEDESETICVIKWTADEAYMRSKVSRAEIESDLDDAFEKAAAWTNEEAAFPSTEERIGLLERENDELFRQLTDTRLALCEIYESLID